MMFDFSFLYGGVRYCGHQLLWTEADGDLVCRLQSLNITLRRARYGEGEEQCLWFENTGEEDSLPLEDICDADFLLPCPKTAESPHSSAQGCTALFGAKGSDWSRLEFTPFSHPMKAGAAFRYAGAGGRSSQAVLPFFDLNDGDEGHILAIGWTGQWFAEFVREEKGVRMRSGIENLCFRLRPHERIRTSSVFVLPYRRGQNEGHNAFRRAVLAALGGKAGDTAPLSVSFWGGDASAYMCEAIKKIVGAGIGADHVWIDAGWHGGSDAACKDEFTDEWSRQTGDWRVNTAIHPDGLQCVSEAARRNGFGLSLWFEPERAHSCVPAVARHPAWFLRTEGDDFRNLLRLDAPQAFASVFGMLCERIRELGITCYRQDFNMDPLPLWEQYDEPGRKGILQIRHVTALYELWDRLKQTFPALVIDNCASGGRRLDWETAKRSIPLWRSDFQCPFDAPAEGAQIHGTGLSWWLPVSGTGTKAELTDLYDFRSAYASALNLRFFTYEGRPWPPDLKAAAAYVSEYLQIRSFFTEDYYPVFGFEGSDRVWGGWQYHSREKDAGIVCAFRRQDCPYESAAVPLSGIEGGSRYAVHSFDGLPSAEYQGKALLTKGLKIAIPERKTSRLFLYEKLKDKN